MKKGSFFIIDTLVKNAALITSLFIVIILISSSAISVTFNRIPYAKNLNFDANEDEHFTYKSLTGLPPKAITEKLVFKTAVDEKNELQTKIGNTEPLNCDIMYGYNAYGLGIPEGPCYFSLADPCNIILLAPTASGDFLSGGTWMADEKWICCEYGSGVLWEIDIDTGDMTSIGGGGQAMNGLSWDPLNNQMYGVGNTDDLFLVDYETGETEFVGSGGTGQTMIALAFDEDGKCYSWDVKFSGD